MTLKLSKAQSKQPGWIRAKAYYPREDKVFENCKHYRHGIGNLTARFYTFELLKERGIPIKEVTFNGRKYHSSMYNERRINYIKDCITLGVVCHEVAHYIEEHETGRTNHTYRLINIVIDVMHQLLEIERKHRLLKKIDWSTQIPEKVTILEFIEILKY